MFGHSFGRLLSVDVDRIVAKIGNEVVGKGRYRLAISNWLFEIGINSTSADDAPCELSTISTTDNC
jgi:hypothetical protein